MMEIFAELAPIVVILTGVVVLSKWLWGRIKGKPSRDETFIHAHTYQDPDTDDEKLSPLEDEILVAMSKPSGSQPTSVALVTDCFNQPRQLEVPGMECIDPNDALHGLKCLEAIVKLCDEDYVEETGDEIYRLTAKGLERARELSA